MTKSVEANLPGNAHVNETRQPTANSDDPMPLNVSETCGNEAQASSSQAKPSRIAPAVRNGFYTNPASPMPIALQPRPVVSQVPPSLSCLGALPAFKGRTDQTNSPVVRHHASILPALGPDYQVKNASLSYSTYPGHMPSTQLRTPRRGQSVMGMAYMPSNAGRGHKSPGLEKGSKGLRHFSLKVCEKVREKGRTSYNEVADELVAELLSKRLHPAARQGHGDPYKGKNIRRRIYDALNVLMAINVIAKEKKEITWLGLPANSHDECVQLMQDRLARQERIRQKKTHLRELLVQQLAFKALVKSNRAMEDVSGRPEESRMILLPYILINTSAETQIDCEMAEDGTEYFFQFSRPFTIHDEIEVLKRMQVTNELGCMSNANNMVAQMQMLLPEEVHSYLEELAYGTNNALSPKHQNGCVNNGFCSTPMIPTCAATPGPASLAWPLGTQHTPASKISAEATGNEWQHLTSGSQQLRGALTNDRNLLGSHGCAVENSVAMGRPLPSEPLQQKINS